MWNRHYREFSVDGERYAIARPSILDGFDSHLEWFRSVYAPLLGGGAEPSWEELPWITSCAVLERALRFSPFARRELIDWLTRGNSGPETTHAAEEARLLDAAQEAFGQGLLVLFRREPPPLVQWEPPRPEVPLVRLGAERHRFAVCWVDELGQPLAGVPLAFEHAGRVEHQSTDAAGIGCVNDSPASSASVSVRDEQKLRELLEARWSVPRENRPWLTAQDAFVLWLRGDQLPSIDLTPDRARTVSIQPYVIRARLLGGFFDSSKCFVLPAGLAAIREIVRSYDEYPSAALLLVGHTDSEGSPAYNDRLSLERAAALEAYLRDDVSSWLKWYGDDVAEAKRWGATEDRKMLGALPDAGSRPKGESAVRWFQRTRNLRVDGVAGPDTRRALIREYMALDGTSLPEGVDVTCHGCGENFLRKVGAEAELENRRVEAFFFPKNPGILPSPPAENSGPGSKEYPEWVRKASKTLDYRPGGEERTLVLRFPLSREEASQAPDSYVLESEDASVRKVQKLASAVPGERPGGVELRFEDLPDQLAYRLQCTGAETYTVFDYATVAELQQQLAPSDDDVPDGVALVCWAPRPSGDVDQSAGGRDEALA